MLFYMGAGRTYFLKKKEISDISLSLFKGGGGRRSDDIRLKWATIFII